MEAAGPMSPPRTPLLAQRAMRAANELALKVTVEVPRRGAGRGTTLVRKLNRPELAVVMALTSQICFFDRLEDFVANKTIADLTGLNGRDVKRALATLHLAGVIDRTPGYGRTASFVRFPLAPEDLPSNPEGVRGTPSEGGDGHLPEVGSSTAGGGSGDVARGVPDPPSEVLSEELPEGDSNPAAIARSLLTPGHDEIGALLAGLETALGPAETIGTLLRLAEQGKHYAWPSDLRKAVMADCAAPSASGPARRLMTADRPTCAVGCANGMIEDPADRLAYRCPVCNGGTRTDLVAPGSLPAVVDAELGALIGEAG